MNKFFLFFFLFCFACDVWTVKNDFPQRIVAGSFVILPDQCVEFIDIFLFGDFPIKFKYENYHLISEKTYPPGHYLISEEGEIIKQKEACKMEIVGENPFKKQEGESGDQSKGTQDKIGETQAEREETQDEDSEKPEKEWDWGSWEDWIGDIMP